MLNPWQLESHDNRTLAKMEGLGYYLGTPCKKGHRIRYTKSKMCRLCEIERARRNRENRHSFKM